MSVYNTLNTSTISVTTAYDSDRNQSINFTPNTSIIMPSKDSSAIETIVGGLDSSSDNISTLMQNEKHNQDTAQKNSQAVGESVIDIPDSTRSRTVSFSSKLKVWGTISSDTTITGDSTWVRKRAKGSNTDHIRESLFDSLRRQSQKPDQPQPNQHHQDEPPQPPGFSPNGKRYHDNRKRNLSEKKATKKAITLFSNERTFVHWIKFAMLQGGIAMTLLNFSLDDDSKLLDKELVGRIGTIGKNVGVCLMVICLLSLSYAACTFHWRHLGISREKMDKRYFDRVGPTVLAIALLVVYAINIVLTLQVTFNMDSNYLPPVFYNGNINTTSTLPGVANNTLPQSPSPLSPLPPPIGVRPFDTPPLPNGATIMVDSEGDDLIDEGQDDSLSDENTSSKSLDENKSRKMSSGEGTESLSSDESADDKTSSD